MAENKKKGFNINSNTYIIMYSTMMVVIVAFVLAFVYKQLKPMQDVNVSLDKKMQVLSALNMRDIDKADAEDTYANTIKADMIFDAEGTVLAQGKQGGESDGFRLTSADYKQGRLALYVCEVQGETKYVVPVYGMGLWGPIWGYIALDADGNTIYGAYFNHESETAGLGAEIKDSKDFQNQFRGKLIANQSGEVSIKVRKSDGKPADSYTCDGITGATLTSDGVSLMLHDCMSRYQKAIQSVTKK